MNTEGLQMAVEFLTSDLVLGKRVLEVGARNINGSLRQVIEPLGPLSYVGTDIVPGEGVDEICPAHKLVERYGPDSFDLAICTSCLDLIADWRAAVANIKLVLAPQGVVYISAPDVYPKRGAIPESIGLYQDQWRFSILDLRMIFADFEILHAVDSPDAPRIAYIVACKPVDWVPVELSTIKLRKA